MTHKKKTKLNRRKAERFEKAKKSVHAKRYTAILKRNLHSFRGIKHQIVTGKSYWWQDALRKGFLALLVVVLCISMLGSLSMVGIVTAYSDQLPDIDTEIRKTDDQFLESIIVDRNGKELYRLRGDRIKENVTLSEIPHTLQWAFLAAEDAQFFEHKGLNLIGTARALLCNFQHNDIAECGGGSSVTQQLVKITTGKSKKSYDRKIEEAILAMQIETTHTKEQILENYLNSVPQGSVLEGVKSGSKYLFGKENLNDLTLAEMAVMAAIANEPTVLSPWGGSSYNKDKSVERANYVLDRMLENKNSSQVTEEEVKQAKVALPLLTYQSKEVPFIAPHFVEYVKKELDRMFANITGPFGKGSNYLKDKGYTIVTSVDYSVQEMMERTLRERATSEDFQKWVGAQNAAGVVMDPNTGEILALVGSRDFYSQDESQYFKPKDNAALSERSLGSTMKPPLYLTAFRMGYDPLTLLRDQPMDLREPGSTSSYVVKNYNRKYGDYGNPLTIRTALRYSLNVPAVTTFHIVGRDAYVDTYYRLTGWAGVADAIRYPSSPLGAANMPLLTQVHAYATMASEGMYYPEKTILEIKDREGNVVFNNREAKGTQVIDKKFVYLINDLNKHYWLFDANPLLLKIKQNTDIAGKTGTGDNSGGKTGDVAFLSYTPNTVVGMWAGNSCSANQCPLEGKGPTGENLYNYMYRYFLEEYSKTFAPARFSIPSGLKRVDGCNTFDKKDTTQQTKPETTDPENPQQEPSEPACLSTVSDWAALPPYDSYLGEKKDVNKILGIFQARPVKKEDLK